MKKQCVGAARYWFEREAPKGARRWTCPSGMERLAERNFQRLVGTGPAVSYNFYCADLCVAFASAAGMRYPGQTHRKEIVEDRKYVIEWQRKGHTS